MPDLELPQSFRKETLQLQTERCFREMSEKQDKKLQKIRHSAAHIMAAAVCRLYKNVKMDIGPAIKNGFYYDFDLPQTITSDDLERVEEEMKKIVAEDQPFELLEMSREEAHATLESDGQTYKLERLNDIPEGEKITFYRCGDFIDLCRGPHLESTGQLNAFKLLNVSGSYYRGNETNPMLQRIYGTAFPNPKQLRLFLKQQEAAKKRDHRKLGRELDLFTIHDEVGPGLVHWHPKGARVRSLIEDFWRREHYSNGYELLYSPHIGRAQLWETSGHLGFYKESMYAPMEIDKSDYYLKPMNCPFHIRIYKANLHSYRDLPLRWAELGTVYRYEKSGVLHGLMRVRGFTQDDAHIFCTPEQVEDEIQEVIRFCNFIWKKFEFKNVKAYLSTRPSKSVGEEERWEQATKSLKNAIRSEGLPYEIDEGGGAFYGPKIDLKVEDAIGREWQMSTIQFDFNLPERFDLSYRNAEGKESRPYMIHRALFGSLERFFGVLVEHYGGAFPFWLAPEQVRIIPITENQLDYAAQVEKKLRSADIRVSVSDRQEKVGAKIRKAQLEKIPYMLIVGPQEEKNQSVSVRSRSEGRQGEINLDDFIANAKSEATLDE